MPWRSRVLNPLASHACSLRFALAALTICVQAIARLFESWRAGGGSSSTVPTLAEAEDNDNRTDEEKGAPPPPALPAATARDLSPRISPCARRLVGSNLAEIDACVDAVRQRYKYEESKFYEPVSGLYSLLEHAFVRCEGHADQDKKECGCLNADGQPLIPPHYTTGEGIKNTKDEVELWQPDWSKTLVPDGKPRHLYWRAIGGLTGLQLGDLPTEPVRIPGGGQKGQKKRCPIFGLRFNSNCNPSRI